MQSYPVRAVCVGTPKHVHAHTHTHTTTYTTQQFCMVYDIQSGVALCSALFDAFYITFKLCDANVTWRCTLVVSGIGEQQLVSCVPCTRIYVLVHILTRSLSPAPSCPFPPLCRPPPQLIVSECHCQPNEMCFIRCNDGNLLAKTISQNYTVHIQQSKGCM